MNNTQYSTEPGGLDWKVAFHVMQDPEAGAHDSVPGKPMELMRALCYSTDPSLLSKVIAKIESRGWNVQQGMPAGKQETALISRKGSNGNPTHILGSSYQEAVCKAAVEIFEIR